MNSFSKIYTHLSKTTELDEFWTRYEIISRSEVGWAFTFNDADYIKFKPDTQYNYLEYKISERLLLKLVKIL